MASEKIRLGVIGANVSKGWAHRSHLPAILASPEFELTAVCTTRRESAEESARTFGARLAFDNHPEMLASPEVVEGPTSARCSNEPSCRLLGRAEIFDSLPVGRSSIMPASTLPVKFGGKFRREVPVGDCEATVSDVLNYYLKLRSGTLAGF